MPQGRWQPVFALRLGAVCLLLAVPARAADSLSRLRSEVRGSIAEETAEGQKPDKAGGPNRHYSADSEDHGDPSGFGTALVYGAALVVAAPLWGPKLVLEDDYDARGVFASYPYHLGDGLMLIEQPNGLMPEADGTGPWLARFGGEYGTNFSNTHWVGGQLLLDSSWRLGIDTEFRRLEENDPDVDPLWLGDTNLVFRFAQNERCQMRAGLGVSFLSDDVGSDAGFNFTYSGDWMPVRPLVFSSALDAGKLGDAGLLHLRSTAGVNWRHAESFVGYDYLRIGHYDLNGLVAGVRLWF